MHTAHSGYGSMLQCVQCVVHFVNCTLNTVCLTLYNVHETVLNREHTAEQTKRRGGTDSACQDGGQVPRSLAWLEVENFTLGSKQY